MTCKISSHNNPDTDPVASAAVLRNFGAELFVLALGDNVNDVDLSAYTGEDGRLMKTDFANVDSVAPFARNVIFA